MCSWHVDIEMASPCVVLTPGFKNLEQKRRQVSVIEGSQGRNLEGAKAVEECAHNGCTN